MRRSITIIEYLPSDVARLTCLVRHYNQAETQEYLEFELQYSLATKRTHNILADIKMVVRLFEIVVKSWTRRLSANP